MGRSAKVEEGGNVGSASEGKGLGERGIHAHLMY